MHKPPFSLSRLASVLAVSMALTACGDSPEKLIDSARQHLEKNDPVAASIELKNALSKEPNSAEARFLLGQSLLESGDAANAEVELHKALELKYSSDKVAVLLTRSLVSRGQFKKVIDEYATVVPSDATDRAEIKTNVAIAYAALGKNEQANAAFAEAVAAQPNYAPALLGQARMKLVAQDVAGAQAIVDGILASNPKAVDALMFRAGLQMGSGQHDLALENYRKVLEINPETVGAHSALITTSLQAGKLDQAQQQLEAMKKALPKNMQTQYMQGMVAFQQKNFALAKEAVQGLLRVASNDPRVLQLAGAIEFESKSDLQAQEYLSQAVARAPEAEVGRRMLVRSYMRSGQPAKALSALQPALDAKQPTAVMLALAGEVYMMVGDAAKAESYFSRASKMDPENTRNRTALAMIQVARGDGRGADELEHIAATDSGTSADMALIATSLRQKQYDQALKAIAGLEKKQPDNLAVHNMRAAALHGKGDIAGARRSLEKALSIDPAYYPAAAALAKLDLMDQKPEQAAARFDSVLAKDPKNTQALLALAELRSREGKTTEAIDLIKRAINAAPNEAMARTALIGYHLRLKDSKSALAAAQEALAVLPDRPEILDIAGRAMQEAGELEQATTTYTKLVALLPNTAPPYLRLAEVQLARKNREAARESLMRGLKVQPESILLQRAVIVMDVDDKRYNEALTRARAIQKQDPKEAAGYLLEGDVLARQKAWREAQAAYRNGLSKTSNNGELTVRLHAALNAGGQSAEANKLADSWLKAHPKDNAFRLYLAGSAVAQKDYATAAMHYQRMLDVQPNNPAVMNDLAWTLGRMGDPKAIGYAEKANSLAPNQPALMDTLGVLQVAQGQMDKGTELLRKAVELAPQAAEIRLNYARALIKRGDKSAARSELETLSKLGDKFNKQADVNEMLKSL